mmetsp:Transcript_15657/g.37599  ORF Transcript_15657/g.37599 Transcript_15657/m.37599 type:complete len:204 (+) Transcript_15657:656-1267(+)
MGGLVRGLEGLPVGLEVVGSSVGPAVGALVGLEVVGSSVGDKVGFAVFPLLDKTADGAAAGGRSSISSIPVGLNVMVFPRSRFRGCFCCPPPLSPIGSFFEAAFRSRRDANNVPTSFAPPASSTCTIAEKGALMTDGSRCCWVTLFPLLLLRPTAYPIPIPMPVPTIRWEAPARRRTILLPRAVRVVAVLVPSSMVSLFDRSE